MNNQSQTSLTTQLKFTFTSNYETLSYLFWINRHSFYDFLSVDLKQIKNLSISDSSNLDFRLAGSHIEVTSVFSRNWFQSPSNNYWRFDNLSGGGSHLDADDDFCSGCWSKRQPLPPTTVLFRQDRSTLRNFYGHNTHRKKVDFGEKAGLKKASNLWNFKHRSSVYKNKFHYLWASTLLLVPMRRETV